MLDTDALRALVARYLSADPSYLLAREALSAANEIERLHSVIEHRAHIDAEDMRQIQDFAARLLIERDNERLENEQMRKRIGIAERMARYLGWAFEQKLFRLNETTELLSQVLREWRDALPKTCPRCGGELNNLSPGISLVGGGIAICTSCLNPGETEIARERKL